MFNGLALFLVTIVLVVFPSDVDANALEVLARKRRNLADK
jgi:hypothetical protein